MASWIVKHAGGRHAHRRTGSLGRFEIRIGIPGKGWVRAFTTRGLETPVYFRGFPHLYELRLQGEPRSLHALCLDATGAARVPSCEDSLPPHSTERSGRE